ncbi:hypothetical protein [Streptomyces sp. NPDC017949]|uniref:hypothetical protein n=1 Tax=Streptomyces sp. NPDC017949 TaxID=3365020 RepID=UPI0037BDA118
MAALRRAADRLVLAAGRDSRAMPALYGPARRLAELTGAGFAEFPGGHVGCTEHPGEFAALLLAELSRKNWFGAAVTSVPCGGS